MCQVSLKLVNKNIVLCTFLLFGAKEEEKNEQNPTSFRGSYLRNRWGYSFQIWYVRCCIW